MIIQVAHTFYLDFLLPRMDAPEPFTIQIKMPEYSAYVMGWNRSEELFHGEVGLSMKSFVFSIKPVDRKSGTLVYRVSDRVIDRIQVALEWDAESIPEISKEVSLVWQERAIFWANDTLDHMRIATGSPTIKRINRSWNPQSGEFEVGVPHTESWFVKDDNTPIATYMGHNTISSSAAVALPETGSFRWSDLCESITKGYAPLHLTLLFEAEDALRSLSLRSAVLAIASACEICGELFAEKQLKLTKTAAGNITKPHDGISFGERYFHLLTDRACGRSLKREDPLLFAEIESAYTERNKLMHTAKFSNRFSALDPITQHRTVHNWITSARFLSQWIESLPLQN